MCGGECVAVAYTVVVEIVAAETGMYVLALATTKALFDTTCQQKIRCTITYRTSSVRNINLRSVLFLENRL